MEGDTTAVDIEHLNGWVTQDDREQQYGHRAAVLWMTGLSGAGKTTIARHLEKILFLQGVRVVVLDGDALREGLCSDLGFSLEDRKENMRRAVELSRFFVKTGALVIAAFISPLREFRTQARSRFPEGRFFEVFCDADLDACERRDVKGLYARARAGAILEFTGISSPYEAPESPEFWLKTGAHSIKDCVEEVMSGLLSHGVLLSTSKRT